jgi:acetyl-CoA carboxylase biotin carboxyl carrier protein
MTFTMENVDDVLQILELLKDTKDIELHMDVGDMKLSVWKGDIGERTTGGSDFSKGTSCTPPLQPEQTAAPAATPAVPKEEPAPAVAPTMPEKAEEHIPEGLVPIKATVTSVFYRKPSPEEPPFVEVGSEVNEDSVVCLLEVMKCFRSINAGVKGRVEKIVAESGQLVEYGTVLMLIRPT